jgi:hypothetical protein
MKRSAVTVSLKISEWPAEDERTSPVMKLADEVVVVAPASGAE